MQFLVNSNFNFIGKRKIARIFSIALILIGVGSLIIQGGPKLGIDFTGGTSLRLRFEKGVPIGDVRSAIASLGIGNAEIKNFGDSADILIRVQEQETSGAGITDAIKAELSKVFPDNPYVERSKDSVGPKIGAELRTKTITSILIALVGMLIYITWRFEFKFAVGAIVALFHDVIITLGVFSILQLEISLPIIAAFLTIVGYSLNDTIVIFDRIRENLKVLRRETYESIVNTSLNQSLTRTIITSLTTLIVVLILYFFGGSVIHNFAFALIIGVIIGTYSSIFVASPIVIDWELRSQEKKSKALGKLGRPIPKRA
ncbi:protein translocase subunit SecF [candidate division KSB1 bacterium]|nr:protein translocase subunit SecF [candidate division KSB1 bacterium]